VGGLSPRRLQPDAVGSPRPDGPGRAARAARGTRVRLPGRRQRGDGAYLVADFQLTNLGHDGVNSASTPFETLDLAGATYGSFTVVDPNKVRYSAVREGGGGSVSYLSADLALLDPNVTVRKYVYYPAPPSGVTSVTFDAGPFGAISTIPIR
jgi:hypothetical protein